MTRESDIEGAVEIHGENTGFVVRKVTYAGRRGCRDKDFYGYGHKILIEFKRPGRDLDVHQDRERVRLARAGVKIHVIDSIEAGVALLDRARANPILTDI